jgi:tRNA(Ile2) C34 agmatinyltransferase TiaS
MSEEKPICPKCGSAMTFAVGQQRHCNFCGADFAVDKHPVATAAHQRKSQGFRGGWKRETQK